MPLQVRGGVDKCFSPPKTPIWLKWVSCVMFQYSGYFDLSFNTLFDSLKDKSFIHQGKMRFDTT